MSVAAFDSGRLGYSGLRPRFARGPGAKPEVRIPDIRSVGENRVYLSSPALFEVAHWAAYLASCCMKRLADLGARIQAAEEAGNSTFGDVEAEFEKLTVNSGSAPGGVLVDHPPDESTKLGIDLWPAKAPWARSQAPEQPEASPMPGDNGVRFDDDQDVAPGWPNPAGQNAEYSILRVQARARMLLLEYAQLLTQGKDLEAQAVAGTEEGTEAGERADEKWNHGPDLQRRGASRHPR
jgi:hypothetical protein